MKITLCTNFDPEEQGYDGTVLFERDNLELLTELGQLFAEFAVASGYTYVKAVGFECDNGDMIWGDE
jgi:hypothetical protein